MSRRNATERSAAQPVALSLAPASNPLTEELVARMTDPQLIDAAVIPWSSPVPAFGDLSSSRVATLGLNPSNREFVDGAGNELDGTVRRFQTLRSLGLQSWREAKSEHFDLIDESCRRYFFANPYDGWFRKLDRIIGGTGSSYYAGSACHLDLIPYATGCKWTDLTSGQRETLLSRVGDTLGLLLKNSPVEVLVLNGRSVVDRFEAMSGNQLNRRTFPTWALPRRSEDVQGLGYEGTVSSVAGITLGREIKVLGFNHNIQSSFGVTREVTEAIGSWIARSARRVLR